MEPDKRFAIEEFLTRFFDVKVDQDFKQIRALVYWAHKLRRWGGYDAPL